MSEEGLKEHELYTQRLASAQKWRELGANPYSSGFKPKHLTGDIHAKHSAQSAEELEKSPPTSYSVAGRVVGLRSFGKAAFVVLQDRAGTVQVHMKKDALGDKYELFKQVDFGDFLGVEGTVFRSKTGELTLSATAFEALTKALRPLPTKHAKEATDWADKQALSDTEQRYRQRYLDLLANPGVRETFKRRIALVKFIRNYLDERGFLEVETPMMHPLVTGAAARPFTTHHNTLDMQLFMRIAPELYLKRLVVGGFDRVYEINRNFRNEGISTRHNPEFTMLEFYQAYATYEDLMDLTEDMISQMAMALLGKTAVKYGQLELDFKKGWRRVTMADAICEQVKDLKPADIKDAARLRAKALEGTSAADAKLIEAMSHGELIAALYEKHVEHTLVQPTFVTQFPTAVSPLARRNDADPSVTDRFELIVGGREIANAFSELNDPVDQKERFVAQVEAKKRGAQETMDYDEDYIRALEHGLPPCAGEGIGIDRLCMLFTDAPSIRDVILFPLLKPQAK
ncbi:MAG: lysine--tRNA ligase [Myxococcaceae bacterium]|nr:lysine--tRNA ligase [Myxococcaceae bacterium]